VAAILLRLGVSAFYRGAYERARELGEESLALSREIGYGPAEAQALGLLGELEYVLGDRKVGAALIEESAELAGQIGFPWWSSRMLRKLTDCLLELGQPDHAVPAAREALLIMAEIGDRQMTVFTIARLARIAAESGRMDEAGLLWARSRPRRNGPGWGRGRRSAIASVRPCWPAQGRSSSGDVQKGVCSPWKRSSSGRSERALTRLLVRFRRPLARRTCSSSAR
jgi:tetratricopeptide (TPR) repeat protein